MYDSTLGCYNLRQIFRNFLNHGKITPQDFTDIQKAMPQLSATIATKGELTETDFQGLKCCANGIDKDDLTICRRRFCILTNPQLIQREAAKKAAKVAVEVAAQNARVQRKINAENRKRKKSTAIESIAVVAVATEVKDIAEVIVEQSGGNKRARVPNKKFL